MALSVLALWLVSVQASDSFTEPVLSVAGIGSNTSPGQTTTYQIELLNRTDQIAYDGVISITLPAGFSYVPSSTLAMGEGWPMESREPDITGQTLTWGPYHLPAAGIQVHNPYGIHTLMKGCEEGPGLYLEAAKTLVGNGGYVKQIFYPIDVTTTGPSECAKNFVVEAYARNLIPIVRLQGHLRNGIWQAPPPGAQGNYAEIARAFANYVAGLPRRDTNPLYVEIWNEPDLWIEWSNTPNPIQYARFFVAVSQAIKRLGDHRIRVINGGLTPGNIAFLDQMLRVPGFIHAFDAWSSHCYPYNHPASYNLHNGTARYGTYAIDCYRHEIDLINRYGRTNVKIMITETGYELGNNTFGFEGFSPINEVNRAAYISQAFATYWQNWPEVVAVTPFQMADNTGHWAKFDWIYPTPPYPKHPQYDAVASLPKPTGQLKPYGFQITFRASVDANVVPGLYFSRLEGRERDGHFAFADESAPVQVYEPDSIHTTFLPLLRGLPRHDGPWYRSTAQTTPPGAIIPTHFLHRADDNARGLAWDPTTGHLFAADAKFERVLILSDDLNEILATLPLDHQPDQLILDRDRQRLYISLPAASEIIAVDTDSLERTKHISLTGGPIFDLAFDHNRQRLYALHALAPNYRGLTVLETPELQRLALVAGADNFPLRTASTIALNAAGDLFVPETTGVWQIRPSDLAVSNVRPWNNPTVLIGLVIDSKSNTIYGLEPLAHRIRVY